MRKYIYIFKTALIENLQYVIDIVFGFINYAVIVFIFLNLWVYMYKDGSGIISGYSINQMIWYVLITEMIWFGTKNRVLTKEISDDIKSGKIAYNINKPYHYILYLIFKYIGDIAIKFMLFLIFGIIVGNIFIGPLDTFEIYYLPFIVIVFFLAILIEAIMRIAISLVSFWFEENKPFIWIYEKIILVLGVVFPVEMFPKFLQSILIWSPIFVITYGPAKLVVDFSFSALFKILLVQFIYLIISTILVLLMYRKGAKRLNVNGG